MDIGSLLEKYKKIKPKDEDKKVAVISAIFELCGIQLERSEIDVKGWNIFLKTSSKVKSEIFIRKPKILANLKEKLGSTCPRDIF